MFIKLAVLATLIPVPAQAAPKVKTFEDLTELVSARGITTIDGLIGALPDELRSNFTLMYKSSSVQYADPANPRVILFGPDAKLLLAFTCDPLDCVDREKIFAPGFLRSPLLRAGFDKVEVIEWKPETRSFEMRELVFSNPGVTPSRPNPALCLQCHRQDPRPNWEHYSLWPGAYGGGDDFRGLLSQFEPTPREATFYLPDESPEALQGFIDTHLSRKRYRHLLSVAEGYRIVRQGAHVTSAFRRNGAFTRRVAQLNFMRIARLAEASGKFKPLLASSLWALLEGDSIQPTGFPGQKFPKGLEACFKTFDAIPDALRRRPEIHQLINGNGSGRPDFTIFAESLGVSTTDWFMNFQRGPHNSLTTPVLPHQELAQAIMGSELWAEYRNLSPATIGSRGGQELEFLGKEEKLEGLFGSCQSLYSFKRPAFSPARAAAHCASCHVSKGPVPAPSLPFDEPSKLSVRQLEAIRQVIREDAHQNGYVRMPLGGDFLSVAEQQALLEYLQAR